MPNLTLEEARRVVCEWMEPKPGPISIKGGSAWWPMVDSTGNREPLELTLDRLWLVEERLSEEQSREYDHLLYISLVEDKSKFLYCWHATANEKTLALAQVIQGGANG